MLLLDLTLPTPAENLALDEALLELAEASALADEVLRIWESPQPLVVLGRSSQRSAEANLPECNRLEIPVLRRTSGGAAIVAGPGCLMYAVVLSLVHHPELRLIDAAHQFVLGRIAQSLAEVATGVQRCGISDLAQGDRKFSGNSLRVGRSHLLYHGTMLYNFPGELVGRCLKTPPRQPEYRAGRSHEAFIANLPVAAAQLRAALIQAFAAFRPLADWPVSRVAQLVEEKYSQESWHGRLP